MPVIGGADERVDLLNTSTPNDEAESIAAEGRRELISALARLRYLHERARALATNSAREQSELQRFLDEFASDLHPASAGSTGMQLNLEAMRAGAEELRADVARSQSLDGSLAVAVQLVQSAFDQLDEDRVFTPVQETADLRLQQAMNAAREEERRRLAREIHDGPAQVLSNSIFAVHQAELMAKRAPDQVAEVLTQLRELLKDGVSEIRRFMFDLRPSMLEDLGLVPTLSRYVADYGRFFGKKIELICDDVLPPLSSDQELAIFRTVQEALQNVHKHAGVGAEATVSLRVYGSTLVLTIEDTGRGFDSSAKVPRPDGGGGLPGMRERAKLIGAEFSVTSEPGAGTVVQLVMPLRGQTGQLKA